MVHELITIMQDQDLRKEFGKRLKELRKEKGWTQKELANQLDIRYSHLNKYESGMHIPPVEKLIHLADIFQVSLDYLVKGLPMDESPIRNELLHKRFKILETFEEEDKSTVIKIIDAIIAKRQVENTLRSFET